MRICLYYIFLFVVSIAPLRAQQAVKDSLHAAKPHPYSDFLNTTREDAQATMFMGQLVYQFAPRGKSFKSGGLHVMGGWNLARFVSNKFILGVFIDYKGVPGFGRQHLSSDFLDAFNANFQPHYASLSDSAHAYAVHEAFNGAKEYRFRGGYFGDYGFMFSPFPQRFGGFLFSVKSGYRSFIIPENYHNEYLGEGDNEAVSLYMRRIRSAEMTFKPFAFFRNAFLLSRRGTYTPWEVFKPLMLSFYYERLDLRGAEFDRMRLDQMVSPAFMSKYGIDHRFGFKIGVGIY